MFDEKVILLLGGTGEIGRYLVSYLLTGCNPKKVIIYSRNEKEQSDLIKQYASDSRIRYFIGDIRDESRLQRAMTGVDFVINMAVLSNYKLCEYNPNEVVKTNVIGAMHLIEASISAGVRKVITLSTEEAIHPISIYGATKMVSDRLLTAANVYSGDDGPVFSIIRFGEVIESKHSLVNSVLECSKKEANTKIPLYDIRATRFFTQIQDIISLIEVALHESEGGEIYVPKTSSYKVIDLIHALGMEYEHNENGLLKKKALHEVLIPQEEAEVTQEHNTYYIINHRYIDPGVKKVAEGGNSVEPEFAYSSNSNMQWIGVDEIRKMVNELY